MVADRCIGRALSSWIAAVHLDLQVASLLGGVSAKTGYTHIRRARAAITSRRARLSASNTGVRSRVLARQRAARGCVPGNKVRAVAVVVFAVLEDLANSRRVGAASRGGAGGCGTVLEPGGNIL